MKILDDTPEPGTIPDVYPKCPPVNLPDLSSFGSPANFFAFEGIDGSGKSTLIREVARIGAERGRKVQLLKLGRSGVVEHALPRAKWLNANPMTLNLLNWVSIFEQIAENQAQLKTNALMLMDRYILTIKVRGLLEGLSTDFMDLLERHVPLPRKLFFIDCDPRICCQRILKSHRTISYFEGGARVVSGIGVSMIERDPEVRRSSSVREAGLLSHLHRMREEMLKLVDRCPNALIVDNSGSLEPALNAILGALGLAGARPSG